MKKTLLVAVLTIGLAVRPAAAEPNYAVVGAILGATAGMVIGHNVDGISKEFAVPVFAIAGGVVGHQYGMHRDHWPDYRDPCGRYRYRDDCDRCSGRWDRYGHSSRRDPWGRPYPQESPYGYPYYERSYRYSPPRTIPTQKYSPRKADPQQYRLPDTHPGVDLLKVSIINRSGIRSDVPILRVNDQYIGPQGEVYKTVPTAEELARRYRM